MGAAWAGSEDFKESKQQVKCKLACEAPEKLRSFIVKCSM